MDFSRFNFTLSKVLKFAGIALLALIVLVFIGAFLLSSFNSMGFSRGARDFSYAPMGMPGVMEGVDGLSTSQAPKMSLRNAVGGQPGGGDAENYEITEHYATIEARKKYDACNAIANLKSRTDVVFSSSNESKRSCSFSFKVERTHTDEILNILKGLNPKDISGTTQTIKREVNDYTNQIQILEAKRASIDDTLTKALTAYDEVTKLATDSRDAGSLAAVIDSKVGVIERLTQERININATLDQLVRGKSEELDRLTYSYFTVTVYENRYVDFEALKQSWKLSIQNLIESVNWSLQAATVGLVRTIVVALPFILYAFAALIVAKYGWRITKRIWQN